jgi:hypothetical protein
MEPSWLGDVAETAARHGFQFLCEAELQELRDGWLPKGTDQLLDQLAGDDVVARGEAIDVVFGRSFRRSVFCRAEAKPERFSRTALHRLRVGPERLPFSEWAQSRSDPEGDALAGMRNGELELHAAPARHALTPGERPEAFALARLQAARDLDVTNLRHEQVVFDDPYPRLVVTALDGTRDRSELIDHLIAEVERLDLVPERGEALRRTVTEGLEPSLQTMAELALLRA